MGSKSFIFIILNILNCYSLKSQITLEVDINTPKAGYKYLYEAIDLNYANALHGGADTIWDLSGLTVIEGDTQSFYFTKNPNYISFPGCEFSKNLDSTYLRSNEAIYRITDSKYSLAYKRLFPTDTYIDSVNEPILNYPFQYNQTMDMGGYTGPPICWDCVLDYCYHWKKADAFGQILLPDSVIENTLRLHTLYKYYISYPTHAGVGDEFNTYEWYDETSELPFIKLEIHHHWFFYFGSVDDTYDTIAWILKSKTYLPINFGIEESEIPEFEVFPNPVKSILHIKNNSKFNIESIYLLNVNGQVVLKFNPGIFSINVDMIRSGIYFLQITSDKEKSSKRVIIY